MEQPHETLQINLDTKTKLNAGKCAVEVLHDALANKFDKVINVKRKGANEKGVYMRGVLEV